MIYAAAPAETLRRSSQSSTISIRRHINRHKTMTRWRLKQSNIHKHWSQIHFICLNFIKFYVVSCFFMSRHRFPKVSKKDQKQMLTVQTAYMLVIVICSFGFHKFSTSHVFGVEAVSLNMNKINCKTFPVPTFWAQLLHS
jgi:hypothetical protein